MLLIQSCIALIVLGYYFVPAVKQALAVLGLWQQVTGIFFAIVSNALAGGLLSEIALVYGHQQGRWTRGNGHNLIFKLILFAVNGAIAYEFYHGQARWFGTGYDWGTIVKKVCMDQFVFSVFWCTPFQTIITQWKHHHYSPQRLWKSMTFESLADQMLRVMAVTWMFWLPTITLVYLMPLMLQVPLAIAANAIWGILLVAVSQTETEQQVAEVTTLTVRDEEEPVPEI